MRGLIISYPGCEMLELFPAIEVLKPTMEFQATALDPHENKRILKIGNSLVKPYREVTGSDFDLVLLPGGDPGSVIENGELSRIIREAFEAKRVIAAICAGPLLLDKTGILSRRSISHGYDRDSIEWLQERKHFLDCELTDNLFTKDGLIFTARPEGSERLALELKSYFEVYRRLDNVFGWTIGPELNCG